MFHNLKTLSLKKHSQKITGDSVFDNSDDSSNINERYDGLQFSTGCGIFNSNITNIYSQIKKELESVSSIDRFKLSISATLILQSVLNREKDTITEHAKFWYSLIVDAYNNAIGNFKSTICIESEKNH